MIEIKLNDVNNFLRVKETLTRMGIANQRDKVLYQSCHILKKRNNDTGQDSLYIVHFKEMMKMDGKIVNISPEDDLRTYSIAKTLESWGMVEVISATPGEFQVTNNFRVLKAAQKAEWKLIPKYVVGS